jgi:hypothetical protein
MVGTPSYPGLIGLTGRFRHRALTRWRKEPVLVLQVQIEMQNYAYPSKTESGERYYEWRDARPEDLTLVIPKP